MHLHIRPVHVQIRLMRVHFEKKQNETTLEP